MRKIGLILLATSCLLIATCTRFSSRSRYVVLSYYEDPTGCVGCPKFQIDFSEGGHVDFHGLAGCALPGDWHYRIPESDFETLVRAFQEADFFNIPRLDPKHVVLDVVVKKVTYKDDRRIHETVDFARQLPRLTVLESRLRNVANADHWLKPSVALYQQLVSAGWNVNTLDQDHENALTSAVQNGDLDSVRFLLQHGARVSENALRASMFSRNPELAELLLNVTHADMKSVLGEQLLTYAARNADMTRLLFKKGADVNAVDPVSGQTPLIAATSAGSLESVVFLVDKGAAVNKPDAAGRSPLWFAATQYNSGFITLLAQRGAIVDAPDPDGMTPLMRASEQCFYWNIEPLLAAGADPSITDKKGRTAIALSIPADDGKCKASRKLLESADRKRVARAK